MPRRFFTLGLWDTQQSKDEKAKRRGNSEAPNLFVYMSFSLCFVLALEKQLESQLFGYGFVICYTFLVTRLNILKLFRV